MLPHFAQERIRLFLAIAALGLAFAFLGTLRANTSNGLIPSDPAVCLPGFGMTIGYLPDGWEQRQPPDVRQLAVWQQEVGKHACIVGMSNEEANPESPNPRVPIRVVSWDGTDLFNLGLPRTLDNKPVFVIDESALLRSTGG